MMMEKRRGRLRGMFPLMPTTLMMIIVMIEVVVIMTMTKAMIILTVLFTTTAMILKMAKGNENSRNAWLPNFTVGDLSFFG